MYPLQSVLGRQCVCYMVDSFGTLSILSFPCGTNPACTTKGAAHHHLNFLPKLLVTQSINKGVYCRIEQSHCVSNGDVTNILGGEML